MILDPPGFFGKVPARGDFVARRVPHPFSETWDAWLGLLTTSVRESAGADWPEVWLTAPLWHFALGYDLAPPTGAAGVLVASADRVGRFFPFTIVGAARGIPDQAWCDSVEELVLNALDDGFDPDRLDADLAHLGAPHPGDTLAPGQSLWRCRGSDRVEPTSTLITGMPGRSAAAAMVLGTGQADPADTADLV